MLSILGVLLPALLPVIEKVIGSVITDKAEAAQATLEIQKTLLENQHELDRAFAESAKAQADINQVEAANPSLFVSGWRPAVGWVCVLGMIYGVLAQPILSWAIGILGVLIAVALPAPPELDTDTLMTLLGGLLGIAGLRTAEKIKKVQR